LISFVTMCRRIRGATLPPLVVLLAWSVPEPGHAQVVSVGPLVTEEGGPLQRMTYTPAAEGADLIGAGRFQADFWMGYSNIFEQDSAATHVLFLDMERLITAVGVRWSPVARLEVGTRLTFETTGGGVLDGFISWWHGALGLGNANREKYPAYHYEQTLRDWNGAVRLDVQQRTLALEDVRLFAKVGLVGGPTEDRALSVRAVARIPTQENRVGPERTDLSVMALGRASAGAWHFHGMLGRSTLRASRDAPDLLRSSTWYGVVAAERRLASWISGVLQYSVSTARVRDIGEPEIDAPVSNFVFGAAGRVGDGWRWDVSFQEDIPPVSPAIDFTLGITVSRTW
jgi:hypothetical protein